MSNDNSKSKSQTAAKVDLQQVQELSRKYAQNRTLGMAVFFGVFILLSTAIGGASLLAGTAWGSGNITLQVASVCLLAICLVSLIFFSTPRWGGQLMMKWANRLYGREGQAVLAPRRPLQRPLGYAIAAIFGACILGSVALGMAGYLPVKYMQPFSAIYVVPFMIAIYVIQRPAASPIILLWPTLFATHALLVVAGAPILFSGRWEPLNMLLPMVGYGLLTVALSHAYSRLVLRKLKRTVQAGMEQNRTEQAGGKERG